MVNYQDYTITLKRIEICDLLLACLAAYDCSNDAEKWLDLHKKLMMELNRIDAENHIE